MEVSFIDVKKLKSDIGVFFLFDDLNFAHNFGDHTPQSEVKSLLDIKKNFKAKKGQILTYLPQKNSPFKEIVIIGLGNKKDLNQAVIQLVASKLVNHLNGIEAESCTVCLNIDSSLDHSDFIKNFYEGMGLRNYKFNQYFVSKKKEHTIYLKEVFFCTADSSSTKFALNDSKLLIDSINFTRDLVSEPANILYPESFAKRCKALEKSGLEVKVLDEKEMKKLGMGALLGVAQGSEQKPYLVIMEWKGNTKNKKEAPIAFIGKGVTFDSGGISLKLALNMGDMKYDMAGAAAVTGVMKLLAERKANVNAIGVIGLVENMPSGHAQRPGDVVTSMSGQTIEIDNTDAEGRLVLCDALWYTQQEYKPKFMINLATLTGAIVIALGENYYAGMFGNNDTLADQLYQSGIKSGDNVWRMPINEYFDSKINSLIADVRNTGTCRGAGSITGAQFLQRFTNNYPWAHLDIAGMAWDKDGANVYPKGATAYGVRLLNQLVIDYFENK